MTSAPTPYLTTEEVAALIRTSEDYVARKCKSGELPAKKLGRSWRITPDAVEAFMRPGTARPTRIRRRAS